MAAKRVMHPKQKPQKVAKSNHLPLGDGKRAALRRGPFLLGGVD